jgi:hypothetical protein
MHEEKQQENECVRGLNYGSDGEAMGNDRNGCLEDRDETGRRRAGGLARGTNCKIEVEGTGDDDPLAWNLAPRGTG